MTWNDVETIVTIIIASHITMRRFSILNSDRNHPPLILMEIHVDLHLLQSYKAIYVEREGGGLRLKGVLLCCI
jgi:hypothetical protein